MRRSFGHGPAFPVRRALLVLPLLCLAACDAGVESAPPVGAQLGEAEIALGASAVVDGLTVTFEAVDEDSRCPDAATCLWEGRAVVALTISPGDARGGPSARLLVADPRQTPEAGVRVGDRLVFAVALTGDALGDVPPVVTVATYDAVDR